MAENWPDATRTAEYNASVDFQLNQMPGKLYPLAGSTSSYQIASSKIRNTFGDVYLEEKNHRNEDTNISDIDYSQRWVKKPKSANNAQLLDRDDVQATQLDLKSPIVAQSANGVRRYHDERFLVGFFGNAWVGEHGDTALPFPGANILPHGNTGLTKAKLIDIREMLGLADVDFEAETPIILIDPESESDLLNITEYTNADYNDTRTLVQGEIKPWLGFRFVRANLKSARAYPVGSTLVNQGGGVLSLPVFLPSGLHRAVWNEFFGRVEQRSDKNYSWQIYADACSAVTRTEEAKCYQMQVKH